MQVQTMVQWNFKQRYTIKPHKCSHCSQWNKVCLRPKKYTYVILLSWILAWVIVIIVTAIRLTIFVLVLLFVSIFMLEVHVLKTNPVKPPDEGCVPKPLGGIKSNKSVNSLTHVILLVLELFSTSGCSSMREQHTGQQSKVTFTTSHTNSCEIGESQIAGMAFFSTGSCSFLCTPRPGMLGNQCTALIKALASCLYRKLTRLLLISCRSQSVCEIVLPIKTCLSMKTSTRMWPYQYVICCPRARLNQVVWWM